MLDLARNSRVRHHISKQPLSEYNLPRLKGYFTGDFDRSQVVDQCLNFLGVVRGKAQIAKAVENNNLNHMKRKEDQSNPFQSNAEGLRFVTDGAIGKGKEQLTADQMERLIGATQSVMTRLGYLSPIQMEVNSQAVIESQN